ncbi:MAG: CsbD family protein [Archangium sp.]|nr:CsbD family protein [Archangium sp.]
MNWDQLQGQAKQLGGKFKEKWAKLTDDDLLLLQGKKEVFLGKLQERTGLVKDEAEKQFDAFLGTLAMDPKAADTTTTAAASPK